MIARPLTLLALLLTTTPLAAKPVRPEVKQQASPDTQRPVAPPATPLDASRGWFYENSDIPMDPGWVFGELPNGVRTAVRRNGVPPGQVAIRVRVDVGSLDEQPAQSGWAHLMEHISFRGSKFVPDGESKRIWQRLGVTFGSDSNASTTPVSTTYDLNLPSATPASLDESLKILAGMMAQPSFDARSMAAETKVVESELREGRGPASRVGDATRQLLFAGQPFAERDPIGTVATLEAATPASLKAFHDRWYRPERTVVVLAGDIDPAVAQALIARRFGDWRSPTAAPGRTDLGVPDPAAPRTAVVVEPSLPASLTLATIRPWRWKADTVAYNAQLMRDRLAQQILNRRLESQARAGASFLFAGVSRDDVMRSADVTSVNVVPAGDRWKEALSDVRTALADAAAVPPTKGEVDREVTEYEQGLVAAVGNANAEQGADLADQLVGALDIAETATSAAASLEVFRGAKAGFTPAAIFQTTQAMLTGTPLRAVLTLPAPDAGAAADLLAALDRPIAVDAGRARQEGQAITMDALPSLGAPGRVVSAAPVGAAVGAGAPPMEVGIPLEVVTLSNGVTLLLHPNTSEANRIYVSARFGTGLAGLGGTKASFAWTGEQALVDAGFAGLNLDQFDRLTTGRQVGMTFGAEEDHFALSGTTRPEDLGDQLRLLATKLSHPSWDERAVERVKSALLATYGARDNSASAVVNRDLEGVLHGGDARWTAPDRDRIAQLTAQSLKAYWTPVLAEGPIEVSLYGDFDRDTAIRQAAATFGALPPRPDNRPTAAERALPALAPATRPLVSTHTGSADQAAAVLAWPTGGGLERLEDSYALEVLAAVFSDRLLDRLRSEQGESYSPQVVSLWPSGATSGGSLFLLAQVKPDAADRVLTLARSIAADLATTPLTADEFERARGPLVQNYQRAFSGNSFWLAALSGSSRDPAVARVPERLATALGRMTPATVQDVARRYLVPDRSLSWIVRPTG